MKFELKTVYSSPFPSLKYVDEELISKYFDDIPSIIEDNLEIVEHNHEFYCIITINTLQELKDIMKIFSDSIEKRLGPKAFNGGIVIKFIDYSKIENLKDVDGYIIIYDDYIE